jgi:hypothetical protein
LGGEIAVSTARRGRVRCEADAAVANEADFAKRSPISLAAKVMMRLFVVLLVKDATTKRFELAVKVSCALSVRAALLVEDVELVFVLKSQPTRYQLKIVSLQTKQ